MKTKTQIQNVTRRQTSDVPGDTPEIALAAILALMVLLRILDICSPGPAENSGCVPTYADRAIISCAVRGDQNRDDGQALASLNGRR